MVCNVGLLGFLRKHKSKRKLFQMDWLKWEVAFHGALGLGKRPFLAVKVGNALGTSP